MCLVGGITDLVEKTTIYCDIFSTNCDLTETMNLETFRKLDGVDA